MSKSALRKTFREILKGLPKETVVQESQLVTQLLLNHPVYHASQHISIFTSMPFGEIDTLAIIQDILKQNKTLYIPRCRGNEMQMVQVTSVEELHGLSRNPWGILEPSWEEDRVQALSDGRQLDLIIMPGMLFDRTRARLGHGKGYYDRYLTQAFQFSAKRHLDPPKTIALALSAQIVDTGIIPLEDHDLRPEVLLTPLGSF